MVRVMFAAVLVSFLFFASALSESDLNYSTYFDFELVEASGWNDENMVLMHGKWMKVPMKRIYSIMPQPPQPVDSSHLSNDSTIMVLIASFRETRCKDTVFNFMNKALNPARVLIGIVQQNQAGDPDCLYEYCAMMNPSFDKAKMDATCPHSANIRMMRLDASLAKGPVYARGLGSELVEHEDFCLQIDAHTDVALDWDYHILREWGRCANEYAVISTYPSNIKDIGRNSNSHWEMPHLCEAHASASGQVRNARARAAANLARPIIAPLWAAGLSLSKCHAELAVPNDVHLAHLFAGEEYTQCQWSIAARMEGDGVWRRRNETRGVVKGLFRRESAHEQRKKAGVAGRERVKGCV